LTLGNLDGRKGLAQPFIFGYDCAITSNYDIAMKTTNASFGIITLAIGVLTLTPARIHALPLPLDITLTATRQEPATTNLAGTIATSTTKLVPFTSAGILKLIETSLGSPFPSGTYLAQDHGIAEALNKAGETTDLSSFISINNTNGTSVGSGSVNLDTGKTTALGAIYVVFKFNDGNGNTFAVDGVIKEVISLTAKDANGDQTETGSFSGTVAGYGTVADSHGNIAQAVFSGTVSGSGKGPSSS
jgi:hypothetical protein